MPYQAPNYHSTTSNIFVPRMNENIQFGPDERVDVMKPQDHTRFVRYLYKLIAANEEERAKRGAHMSATEIDLLGIVEPTGTDCERKEKREVAEDVSVPDHIYPFGWMELTKFAAEVTELVLPVEAPYAVAAGIEKKELSKALTKAFRGQAVRFDHRNNLQATIFDTIALDLGAFELKWGKRRSAGQNAEGATGGAGDDFQGVEICTLNPYNVTWDHSVDLCDVATEGEFFASFHRTSLFRVRRENNDMNYLSETVVDRIDRQLEEKSQYRKSNLANPFQQFDSGASLPHNANWYYVEPEISKTRADVLAKWGTNRNTTETSFSGLFADGYDDGLQQSEAIHLTKMFVRIQPGKWGLGKKVSKAELKREPFAVWEIHMYGPGIIGYAQPIDTGLDHFPIGLASMNFKRRFTRSFKFGEHAAQLGLYASTLMNMTKRSMRKGLEGGLTIFNSRIMDLNNVPTDGGKVPIDMMAFDDDLRRHILQLNDMPDTKHNMNDVGGVTNILQSLFPTNAQPAMAGLDRATTYQAQAVMATSLRSLVYYATIIDGQLMVPSRLHMHRWNMKRSSDMTYLDERTAQLMTVEASEIQGAEFELVQSQPLMGIDRMRIETILRDLINILMQSGGALSPIQMVMLRHFVDVSAITLDMEEFEQKAAEEAAAFAEEQAANAAAAGVGPDGQPVAPQ